MFNLVPRRDVCLLDEGKNAILGLALQLCVGYVITPSRERNCNWTIKETGQCRNQITFVIILG